MELQSYLQLVGAHFLNGQQKMEVRCSGSISQMPSGSCGAFRCVECFLPGKNTSFVESPPNRRELKGTVAIDRISMKSSRTDMGEGRSRSSYEFPEIVHAKITKSRVDYLRVNTNFGEKNTSNLTITSVLSHSLLHEHPQKCAR